MATMASTYFAVMCFMAIVAFSFEEELQFESRKLILPTEEECYQKACNGDATIDTCMIGCFCGIVRCTAIVPSQLMSYSEEDSSMIPTTSTTTKTLTMFQSRKLEDDCNKTICDLNAKEEDDTCKYPCFCGAVKCTRQFSEEGALDTLEENDFYKTVDMLAKAQSNTLSQIADAQ